MKFAKTIPVTLLAASIAFASVAQEDTYLDNATKKATAINQSAVASQQTINSVTADIESKLQQFKTINKEIDGLQVYNGQLDKQIANQVEEMAQLNAAIDEVSVIERQITPLMMRMIDGLEQFVALDVPFLPTERAARLPGGDEAAEARLAMEGMATRQRLHLAAAGKGLEADRALGALCEDARGRRQRVERAVGGGAATLFY